MSILIVLLVSYFLMIDSAYGQQNAFSTFTSTHFGPSQEETNITIKIVVFFIFCYAAWTIYKRLEYKYGKYRKRQYFPTYVKQNVIRKQHYKCAICKKSAGLWDYDHKDGKRSNNDPSNCQALCPNCHAKKTRGLLQQSKK